MTRREVVVAFAALSIYLEDSFEAQLSQLNSRELKLVQVYRDKLRGSAPTVAVK